MHIAEIETRLSVHVSCEGDLVRVESNGFVVLVPVFERPLGEDEETGDQLTRDSDWVVKSQHVVKSTKRQKTGELMDVQQKPLLT